MKAVRVAKPLVAGALLAGGLVVVILFATLSLGMALANARERRGGRARV